MVTGEVRRLPFRLVSCMQVQEEWDLDWNAFELCPSVPPLETLPGEHVGPEVVDIRFFFDVTEKPTSSSVFQTVPAHGVELSEGKSALEFHSCFPNLAELVPASASTQVSRRHQRGF